jgi:3-phosphoglycerate kinase
LPCNELRNFVWAKHFRSLWICPNSLDGAVTLYIGGGEGGTALEKYGQSDWVTHTFTAGGTVLNALCAEPVPYLVALRAAAGGK